MSNTQSNDSLRELNAKLLAEIGELRKKFAEIKVENDELKDKNTEIPELRRKFAELEAEKAELKARIAGLLKQAVEKSKRRDVENTELKARIEELEKNKADSSAENVRRDVEIAEIKAEVVKLRDNNEENKESTQDISLEEVVNVPSSVVDQPINANPLDTRSKEDIKTDEFLDSVHKKKVSNEIRQRNKEKKLLCELADQDVTSCLSRDKKTVTIGNDQDSKLSLSTDGDTSASPSIEDHLSCDTKTITCTDSEDAPSDETSGLIATQPLDRNQATEQILKRDLSRPISSMASVELHNESILNNAIEGSTQRLAYWIDEAIRMGLKEILCLYHYSFKFEEKVKNITADGKTKDKTARSMIYKDMLQYLPNVTLGNLRIRTHRAKNILMLFGEKGVGIDRIKLVTCSASDISRLNNTQIQNIIDYVNDQVHKTVTNGNDQSHVTEISETLCPRKNLPKNTPAKTKNDQISAPIPS